MYTGNIMTPVRFIQLYKRDFFAVRQLSLSKWCLHVDQGINKIMSKESLNTCIFSRMIYLLVYRGLFSYFKSILLL